MSRQPAAFLAIAALCTFACSQGSDDRPPRSAAPMEAFAPLRSDAEAEEALRTACRAGAAEGKPVLVEFSAEWCGDCIAVQGLKRRAVLAEELARWSRVAINPGRFDRNRALLGAYGVEAIARWVAVRPDDCEQPPTRWRAVAARTLEPVSGAAVREAELATWLAGVRRANDG